MEASPLFPDRKHARYALEEEDTKMIPSGVPLFWVDNTEADTRTPTHTRTRKLNPPTPEPLAFYFFPQAVLQQLVAASVSQHRACATARRASVSMHICKVHHRAIRRCREAEAVVRRRYQIEIKKYICDLNGCLQFF